MSGWRSTFGHIALLLWAFTALPLYAQSAPVQPKIVLQTLSKVLDAAAWTPDERYLLTVSGISREFIIWDVQQRLIVDRLRLPGEPNLIGAEMMRLTSIEVSADSRMARVSGTVSAAQTEGNVVGRLYLIDLVNRTIQLERTPAPRGATFDDVTLWFMAIGVIGTQEPEPEMSMASTMAEGSSSRAAVPRSR